MLGLELGEMAKVRAQAMAVDLVLGKELEKEVVLVEELVLGKEWASVMEANHKRK